MDKYCNRRGQIPAFGNWDIANEMPITQYFENARKPGLVPCSSSSYGKSDLYVRGEHDLYALDFKKPVRKTRRIRDMNVMVNDKLETRMRKHGKVNHVTEYPSKPMNNKKINQVVCSAHRLPSKQHPKAVDEDLYKISPELLRTTKRKKIFGFISKFLLPCVCVS